MRTETQKLEPDRSEENAGILFRCISRLSEFLDGQDLASNSTSLSLFLGFNKVYAHLMNFAILTPEMQSENEVSQTVQSFYDKAKEAFDINNLDYAQTLLRNILYSNPEFHKARSLLRITQLKKSEGYNRSFLQQLFQKICLIPRYGISSFYLWKKQWIRAIQSLEDILLVDPLDRFALQKIVRASFQLGWLQTGIETLEVLKKLSPSDSQIPKELARLYLKSGDLEKSKKYFEETLRLSPEEPIALKGLKDIAAMRTIEQGKWTHTTSYREKIRDEREAEILQKASRQIKTEEDLVLLMNDLEKKIQTQPDNTTLLKELSQLYIQSQRKNQAIEIYRRLSKLLPFDENIQRELAHLEGDELAEEIIKVTNELSKNPSDEKLIARLKELKRKEKEARLAECKTRVERYPHNLSFRFELGQLYFEMGKFNPAIQEFQNAVKDPQWKIKSLYYLGLCFKENGFYDLAEKQLLKVLEDVKEMDAFKKEAIYNLGQVYEATNQIEKAAAEYKKIFEVDINFKDVADKIKKAYKN